MPMICWKGRQKLKLLNEISSQYIDEFVQERHNPSALAMELRFFAQTHRIYAEEI